mgnify:CR=1 FL=1
MSQNFANLPSLEGRAVSGAILAPSVTARRWKYDAPYHNPGMNLVEFDDKSFKILNYKQYYKDMKSATKGKSIVLKHNSSETILHLTLWGTVDFHAHVLIDV